MSRLWRPRCIESCRTDSECPRGHECSDDTHEDHDHTVIHREDDGHEHHYCTSEDDDGDCLELANQCVPFRCPRLRQMVGERAMFRCKEGFFLSALDKDTSEVECASVEGRERPVRRRDLDSASSPAC